MVVYNHHVEPLMELCDVYATARRAAYLMWRNRMLLEKEEEGMEQSKAEGVDGEKMVGEATQGDVNEGAADEGVDGVNSDSFPLDPTLLLTPTLHHSVARPWQVLPGRTHPMMTGKGGADGGYVVTSTRVIPIEGRAVQARGRQGKSRKRQKIDGQSGEEGTDKVDDLSE